MDQTEDLLLRLSRKVKQPIEVVRPPLELLATKYGIPLESVLYIVIDLAEMPRKKREGLRETLVQIKLDAAAAGLSLDNYVELLMSRNATKH